MLRFSIRDLLWLTFVVAAFAIGWYRERLVVAQTTAKSEADLAAA